MSPERAEAWSMTSIIKRGTDLFEELQRLDSDRGLSKKLALELKPLSRMFSTLWPKVSGNISLDPFQVDMILYQLEETMTIDGDVAEFGVNSGGVSILCALMLQELGSPKMVHLFDAFAAASTSTEGSVTDLNRLALFPKREEMQVRSAVYSFGLQSRCQFHPGWFSDTVSERAESLTLSLSVIGSSMFAPTLLCTKTAIKRTQPGGRVIVKNAFDISTGASRAFEQAISGGEVDLFFGPSPQGIVVKRPEHSRDLSDSDDVPLAYLRSQQAYACYLSAVEAAAGKAREGIENAIALLST